MQVPDNLDYDMWLGSTPEVYYTEKRVHPQVGYDRPGWLRCEQFGASLLGTGSLRPVLQPMAQRMRNNFV